MNRRSRDQPRRGERGATSVEIVLLVPVLVGCILVIAGGARYVEARGQVGAAAAAGARAASLASDPSAGVREGRTAAVRATTDRGPECASFDVHVDTGAFQPGGVVSATVTCVADLSDLVGFGLPGSKIFTASTVVPVESHRVLP